MVRMNSEKRFSLAYELGDWWAVKDYDITLWKEEVVDELNNLNDEIQRLKNKNSHLLELLEIDRIVLEDFDIEDTQGAIKILMDLYFQTRKENEMLTIENNRLNEELMELESFKQ